LQNNFFPGAHSGVFNLFFQHSLPWKPGPPARMALDLRVPVTRIADIVNERRGITADTALRFARYFKNSAAFWMNLQTRFELEVAEDEIASKVERDVRPLDAATAR
jgi:addiction module HigA family antidote